VDYLIFIGDFGVEEFKAVMKAELEWLIWDYEIFSGYSNSSNSPV
jgi:hypothetical protein